MELIIGGAYQGKLDYARTAFGVTDGDVEVCTPDRAPDLTKRCLVHYENYVLYCLRSGEKEGALRADAVVVADDIFCGVVPMDAEVRAWREAAGRSFTALAFRADTVTRLFCGLARRLKG